MLLKISKDKNENLFYLLKHKINCEIDKINLISNKQISRIEENSFELLVYIDGITVKDANNEIISFKSLTGE